MGALRRAAHWRLLLPVVVAAALQCEDKSQHCEPDEASLLQAGRRRPGAAALQTEEKKALNILFVGNSFTYGPPEYDEILDNNMSLVNLSFSGPLVNLPRMFKLVAESHGHAVNQQEDTIGGCTLALHRPSINPQALNCSEEELGCRTVENPRVNAQNECTIQQGILFSNSSQPCPQNLMRQAYGLWDVVVLQDQSKMQTVKRARDTMTNPAFSEFRDVLDHIGAMKRDSLKFSAGKRPLIASYMTWAYYLGFNYGDCPGEPTNPKCYPAGHLNDLTNCSASDAWVKTVNSHMCQTYSLARGAADSFNHGADVLVPAGLAWEAAKGSVELPSDCKASIDAEYDGPNPLGSLDLPLRASDRADARWNGTGAHDLYRDKGWNYTSKYCDDGCHHDHHASATAMYLNACVFFATLFQRSPVGADFPRGQIIDGYKLPTITQEDAEAMQRIAADTVLPHMPVWWKDGAPADKGLSRSGRPAPAPARAAEEAAVHDTFAVDEALDDDEIDADA